MITPLPVLSSMASAIGTPYASSSSRMSASRTISSKLPRNSRDITSCFTTKSNKDQMTVREVWHCSEMPLSIPPETLKQLQASVKRYLVENVDSDVGDLKTKLLLDFCLQEIGAVAYNHGIADAQTYFQARVGDLDAVCFQPEFTYWRRK